MGTPSPRSRRRWPTPSGRSKQTCSARSMAAIACRHGKAKLPPGNGPDRLAASEAYHVVGWSRQEMGDALGIATEPLANDPLLLMLGFAPWEPWPATIAEGPRFARSSNVSCGERRGRGGAGPPSKRPRRKTGRPPMSHCPDKTDQPLPVAPPYDENPEWGSTEPDYAAYDEWAAAAEAPAFAPTAQSQVVRRDRRDADRDASLGRRASGLHPCPCRRWDRQDLDADRRGRPPDRGRRRAAGQGARRHLHQQGGGRNGAPDPRRDRPGTPRRTGSGPSMGSPPDSRDPRPTSRACEPASTSSTRTMRAASCEGS